MFLPGKQNSFSDNFHSPDLSSKIINELQQGCHLWLLNNAYNWFFLLRFFNIFQILEYSSQTYFKKFWKSPFCKREYIYIIFLVVCPFCCLLVFVVSLDCFIKTFIVQNTTLWAIPLQKQPVLHLQNRIKNMLVLYIFWNFYGLTVLSWRWIFDNLF